MRPLARSAFALLIVVAPLLPAYGFQPSRQQVITAAKEIIRTARYGTLVTNGSDGQPQARIVDAFAPDSDLTIWIATNPLTRKVQEIRNDPRVSLLYFVPATSEYVTVIGTATLDTSARQKAAHWKPAWKGLYKNENRGDDYMLLRVRPSRLEVVSVARGINNDAKTWLPVTIDLAAGPPQSSRKDPRLSLDRLPVTARIDLPTSADWIAFGFKSIWVVNYRPDRVSRIDSATNKVIADIPIGRNGCLGLVVAENRVWVPSCFDGVMNEIDPSTDSVVRKIAVPIKRGREGAFAFADGSFWIPDNATDSGSTTIARVDPRTGATLASITTGVRSDVVITGFSSVWVASSGEDVVARIDPATNKVVARIPVGASPKFMTAGEGAIWVQNRKDGSVSRIDPATNREVAHIDAWAPTAAGDISAGGGAVWLSVDGMPVTRIDARTNAVTHQYVGGTGADAVRFGMGALWVADHRVGQLWRIDAGLIVPDTRR